MDKLKEKRLTYLELVELLCTSKEIYMTTDELKLIIYLLNGRLSSDVFQVLLRGRKIRRTRQLR